VLTRRAVLGLLLAGCDVRFHRRINRVQPYRPPPSEGANLDYLWSSAFPGKPTGVDADGSIDGISVIMDVDSVSMGELEIINGGTLKWIDGYDAVLTASNVHVEVGSNIEVGSEDLPYAYPNRGKIVLTGAPVDPDTGHSRSIMFHTSRFFARTSPPSEPTQDITDHIAASGTSATMSGDITDWHIGDEIRISPTDWYDLGGWEYRTITDITGQVISWSGGLTNARWGKLQYPTDAGLSLTAGTFTAPSGTPTVVNERARIDNLTRTFTIESIEDTSFSTDHHGCHVMIMDIDCVVDVDGIEIRRGGQAGHLGRYGGIHWHQISYRPDSHVDAGDYVGDIPDGNAVMSRSVVRDSVQRGNVIHGTNNVVLDRNVYDNIRGHAVFLEAGIEKNNEITNSSFGEIFDPYTGYELLQHELFNGESGSACIWLAFPANVVTGNYGAYAAVGLWNSFPGTPVADYTSNAVGIYARNTRLGTIDDNRFNSMRGAGAAGRGTQIDTDGNIDFNGMYAPTDDDTPTGNNVSFEISRMTCTKCQNGAYKHNTGYPHYNGWVTASCYWIHFVGKTGVPSDSTPTPNKLGKILSLGYSLNNANEEWAGGDYTAFPSSAWVSYHSTIPIVECTAMHFREALPYEPATMGFLFNGGGAWATHDYYVNGYQRGTYFDHDNQFIDAPRAMRTRSFILVYPGTGRQSLSSAIWDPHGQRTGLVGNWVFNIDFMTYGATVVGDAPTYLTQSAGDNGVVISDECYGWDQYYTDFDPNQYTFDAAVRWQRLNPSTLALVDTYEFPEGTGGTDYFRFVALVNGGVYTLDYPGHSDPTTFSTQFTNLRRDTDSFTVGHQFDVSAGISANYRIPGYSSGPNFRGLSSTGSLANVLAGDGTLYYTDSTGAELGDGISRIWIKFVGTLNRGTLTTGTWQWLEQPLWHNIDKV